MPRRNRKDGLWRQVRRYALEGNDQRVEECLLALLAEYPGDAEAEAELRRLHDGERLQMLESSRERRERLQRQHLQKLQQLSEQYISRRQEWLSLPTAELRRYLSDLRNLPPSPQVDDFTRELEHLIARRNHRLHIRLAAGSGALLFTGALILCLHSWNRAALITDEELRLAMINGNWERVDSALQDARSPRLRMSSQQLRQRIPLAEDWQRRQQEHFNTLRAQLARWSADPAILAALPEVQRRQFAKQLDELAYPHASLSREWAQLRESLKQDKYRSITELVDRLSRPLPPLPVLRGDIKQDGDALSRQRALIRERREEYELAALSHTLSPELIAPLDAESARLDTLEADLNGLRHLLAILPGAQNYRQYRNCLSAYTPQQYRPGIELMQGVRDLPREEDLLEHVRNSGVSIPHPILDKALRQAGASFCAEVPATREQTYIAEQLFSSAPLNRPFYRYKNHLGLTRLSERKAQVIHAERGYIDVRITLSPFDPSYRADADSVLTWPHAASVTETVMDARPVLEAAGIDRATFFSSGNLPHMLETAINAEAPSCPPLARAYIYDRLMRIVRCHPSSEMSGLSFSPTMRADFRSFENVCRACRLDLRDGLWLTDSPRNTRLNEIFATWFAERRGRNYSREISDNFAELVDIHPRYAGFIGRDGRIVLRSLLDHKLDPGARIWYLSRRPAAAGSGLAVSPPPAAALPAGTGDGSEAGAAVSSMDGADARNDSDTDGDAAERGQEASPAAASAESASHSLSVGNYGQELDDPVPLSPVFTVEKDF